MLHSFLLSGKPVEIKYIPERDGRESVSFDGKVVTVKARDEPEARKLLYLWARKRASLQIRQSAWRQSRMLKIDGFRLNIRDQRSRWGSCSSRKNLSFNFRIGLAPKEVMDYVVLHELIHLKFMNHSPAFWKELARYCPQYKEHEKWLKRNGNHLMNSLSAQN
ncbi:MAG: SprT family zinc-dependent metalloprotease [Conexivisphaerales archaeon]